MGRPILGIVACAYPAAGVRRDGLRRLAAAGRLPKICRVWRGAPGSQGTVMRTGLPDCRLANRRRCTNMRGRSSGSRASLRQIRGDGSARCERLSLNDIVLKDSVLDDSVLELGRGGHPSAYTQPQS